MIVAPSGVKVYIACGVTDMRKGIDGLATLVQEVLVHDPFSGHLFAFRGGKANLIKILYWDGTGLCLFTKRLEHRIFEWPTVGGAGEIVSLAEPIGGLSSPRSLRPPSSTTSNPMPI
jgi:transposase